MIYSLAKRYYHDLSLPSMVLFSIKWNSIRLGGPAHGIVTKTVHKTLPGGGGGSRGGRESRGGRGSMG